MLGPLRSDTGDFVDFTPYLHELSEALERSRIAIYPVRQIMLGSANGVDGIFGEGIGSEETLDEFSGMTGGRPNTGKDIGAAIKQAMEDLRTSYHISYYPTPPNWNDKLHKIRVTSTRKGVRLQAKTGYYAWAEASGSEARQAIDSLIPTPFDAAEIGLRGAVSLDPQNPGVAHLELDIDARDIVLARERNQYSGQLSVSITAYLLDGGTQSSPILPFDLHYNPEERDEALKDGIHFDKNVGLEKSVTRIRAIVYDRGSNATGSVTIPVKQ
jgi:hypothetical protein